jgi:hypothetical protein
MSHRGTLSRLALTAVCLSTNSGIVWAAEISGTISETMNITEDSRLTGDVTCAVTNAPCLDITVSNVTLDLNGFSVTGQADRQTGCAGVSATGPEQGIRILNQTGVKIQGPGVIQRFRAHGIIINASTNNTITGVTTATNCNSGILIGGDSNLIEANISIANGNLGAPCGGI